MRRETSDPIDARRAVQRAVEILTGGDMSNVIELKFKNNSLEAESVSTLACKVCKNKTYIVRQACEQNFPYMVCACCGSEIGTFGWCEPAGDES